MDSEIREFEAIRKKLLELINSFPQSRREEILFDKWSLKDIISHLSNWMIHDIDCLKSVQEDRLPNYESNIDEFNERGVEKRKKLSWEDIHQEFAALGEELVGTYKKIPESLWNKKIWPNKDETPAKFLAENLSHWQLESSNILKKSTDIK